MGRTNTDTKLFRAKREHCLVSPIKDLQVEKNNERSLYILFIIVTKDTRQVLDGYYFIFKITIHQKQFITKFTLKL